MTLKEGFEHFLNSEGFKAIAKDKKSLGGKYRGYKTRFYNGDLKEKTIIKILIDHGYTIEKEINVKEPK